MSKRHTASRRRSYGRRQHEMHERLDRRQDRRADRAWRHGQGLDLDTFGDPETGGDTTYGFAG